jgi:hypothetical protein
VGPGRLQLQDDSGLASRSALVAEHDQGGSGGGRPPRQAGPSGGGDFGFARGTRRGGCAWGKVEDHEGQALGFEQALGAAQGIATRADPGPEHPAQIDPCSLGRAGIESIPRVDDGGQLSPTSVRGLPPPVLHSACRGARQQGEEEGGSPGGRGPGDFPKVSARKAAAQELVDGVESARVAAPVGLGFSGALKGMARLQLAA